MYLRDSIKVNENTHIARGKEVTRKTKHTLHHVQSYDDGDKFTSPKIG